MSEENKTLIHRYVQEVGNKGNLEVIDAFIAPDYTTHGRGQMRSSEDQKQTMARMRAAFPDFQTTIEDMVAEGDKVVVRRT